MLKKNRKAKYGIILALAIGFTGFLWYYLEKGESEDAAKVSSPRTISPRHVVENPAKLRDYKKKEPTLKKTSPSINFALANRKWLESKAPALTPDETKAWLESKGYSADAFMALLMSNSPPPAGQDSATFYKEMFERHKDDPAVVMYGLLIPFGDKQIVDFEPDRLQKLAPSNPIGDYLYALSVAKSGDITASLAAVKEGSEKQSPTAYFERIRSGVLEMFQFSGRSEEGANAWANFSLRESDLSSIPLKFQELFNSSPTEDVSQQVLRAALIADMGLVLEEVPMAGPESYSWNEFTMPGVIKTLQDHQEMIPANFNDTAENVLAKLKQMELERADDAAFYFGGHAKLLDSLENSQREEFYKESKTIGLMEALRNLIKNPNIKVN